MEIRTEEKNRYLMVHIKGELDHHTAEEIREKIDKTYSRTSCKDIVFDFEQMEFMDSSGIGVIIGRYKNAKKQGGHVFVANMSESIQRIFNISGLHKIIKSYATMRDFENERQ